MSASLDAAAVIERSAEQVFATATDPERVSQWMSVSRLEPLDSGPVRPGWRFRETRTLAGRPVSAVIEVVEHRGPEQGPPPYRHAARSEVMGVEGSYRLEFVAEGPARCRVTVRAEVRATKFLAKPLVAMAAKAMKEHDADMLQRLKALCESEPAAGADDGVG